MGLSGAVIASPASHVVTDDGLVPYTVVGDAIPQSLTGKPGDPAAGLKVVLNRKQGNCLACHNIPLPGGKAAYAPGNVGPPLNGVGGALSAGELRLRVVNSKLVDPATIMPAYYRVSGLYDVDPKFAGKPMLTAQQVEDVVAFLTTLK